MKKNKIWSYETKVEIVELVIKGRSYSSVAKEYGITSNGMIANWKKAYEKGTLSNLKPGAQVKNEAEDYEILKKCYAQLMKIRSK